MSALKYDLVVIGSGPSGQRPPWPLQDEEAGGRGGGALDGGRGLRQHRHHPLEDHREAVMHLSGYNYKSVYGMNYRVKKESPWPILPFACRR